MELYRGGWVVGGGVGVGGVWEAKGGLTIHQHGERAAVCSVKHKSSHGVHVRTRRSLGAV